MTEMMNLAILTGEAGGPRAEQGATLSGEEVEAVAGAEFTALLLALSAMSVPRPADGAPAVNPVGDARSALLPVAAGGPAQGTAPAGAGDLQVLRQALAWLAQRTEGDHGGAQRPATGAIGALPSTDLETSAASPASQPTVTPPAGSLPPAPNLPDALAPVSQKVEVPVNQPQWGKAVGERLTWMLGEGIQHARLRLDPPTMGSLDIRLSLSQDSVSVSFTAQHAATGQALEAALPRLRDMLAEVGVSLGEVHIHQGDASAGDASAEDRPAPERSATGGDIGAPADDAVETGGRLQVRGGDGLVDDFA